MKVIFNHIERIKGQPHHIRKRVAFASAAFGTALITFVWLAVSLGTGAFALRESSFVADTETGSAASTLGTAGNKGFAGAGAAPALSRPEAAAAHIEIVDALAPATGQQQAEQTTIPF